MAYYPSNCNVIESHIACDCSVENARVRSVGLIHKSVYTDIMSDPEDPTIWQEAINAGMVIILPQTQGDYNGGEPIYSRGFGFSEETLLAYKFNVNYKDPDYIGNLAHYNSVTGSRNFYIAFCTSSIMRISQRPGTLIATNPVANSLKDQVNYVLNYTWTHNLLPLEFTIPDNVFECAPAVVYDASFDNSFDDSFDIP